MTDDELYQWRSGADTATILGITERTVRRAAGRGDMLRREHLGRVEFMPNDCAWTHKTLANMGVVLTTDTAPDTPSGQADKGATLDDLARAVEALREDINRLKEQMHAEQQARAEDIREEADRRHQAGPLLGALMWVWSWFKVQADRLRRALK